MATTGRPGDAEARSKSSGGVFSLSPLLLVFVSAVMLATSACSSGAATDTPPLTRAATQTPWIVYVPITVTPMPVTFTPLPTVTVARQATPTRTVAKPATTKAAAATATKPPVAVVPTATPALSCSASSVQLRFPQNGDPRKTKVSGPASDVFDFQWSPFQSGEADPQMGYMIKIESKYVGTNRSVGGDAKYISHNGFLKNNQHYIYDARAVHGLVGAGEANVAVFWNVTVVKTTGSFDDVGGVTGSVVNCSPPSQTWTISLIVLE
jgi:hypothetical protein